MTYIMDPHLQLDWTISLDFLLPPPYCLLPKSLGQLYRSSLCLQANSCQRAATAGKPPQPVRVREATDNPSSFLSPEDEGDILHTSWESQGNGSRDLSNTAPACRSSLCCLCCPVPFMSISSDLLPGSSSSHHYSQRRHITLSDLRN